MNVSLSRGRKLCVSLLFLARVAPAQTSTGGLTGVVTDPGGAVIPGAALRPTNFDTNEARQQTSNEVGAYTFTALAPGRYRLALEHAGFKRFVEEPIEVRVQQFVTLDQQKISRYNSGPTIATVSLPARLTSRGGGGLLRI